MPIDEGALFRTFVVVSDQLTAQQILESSSDVAFIVIRFADGRIAVVKRGDFRTKINLQNIHDVPVFQMPEYVFQPYIVSIIQLHTVELEDDERIASMMEDDIIAVLENDTIVGLLLGSQRDRGMRPIEEKKEGISTEARELPEERFINAEVEDHDKETPLKLGERYTLAFWLDSSVSPTSLTHQEDVKLRTDSLFGENEAIVELTINLQSTDFRIKPEERRMRVPRVGPAEGRVRFEIEPLKEGEGTIQCIFLKEGIFIQVMTIKLYTGDLFSAKTLGREVDAAFRLERPRDLSIVITEAVGGFQIIMSGATAAYGYIPLTLPHLDHMISRLRTSLREVIYFDVEGERIYQQSIAIPPDVRDITLKKLAVAGYDLFEQIFYGPGMDAQINLLGDRLRSIARSRKLKIQIFSQRFLLPWGLLYVGEDPLEPEPEMFLGLKHIIEHIPLQTNMKVLDEVIDGRDGLLVSLNLNTDIDSQMGYPLVEKQIQYWCGLEQSGTVKLTVRDSGAQVLDALKGVATGDQIVYFYCHASSKSLEEDDGPDKSFLMFAKNQKLLLEDLRRHQRMIFPNEPLIFINACESAELSSLFYDGFVPYFMAKGARGVIGTECETPALFAQEWAERFFECFMDGKSLGEVMLSLRREYFFEHNNILGLMYALYMDGDTRLVFDQPVRQTG